jgi:hypothetical protein
MSMQQMSMSMMEYPRLQFPPDSHFAQSGLSPNAPTFNPGPAMALVGMMAPASYDYAPYGMQLQLGGSHNTAIDGSGGGHQHQHQHQHQQDMYGSGNMQHLSQQYFLQDGSSPMVGMGMGMDMGMGMNGNMSVNGNTSMGGPFGDNAAPGSGLGSGPVQMVYSSQPHTQALQQQQQPQMQMQMQSTGAGGGIFYPAANGYGHDHGHGQQTGTAALSANGGMAGDGFSNGSGSGASNVSSSSSGNSNGFAEPSSSSPSPFQQFATAPSVHGTNSLDTNNNNNKSSVEMNSETF